MGTIYQPTRPLKEFINATIKGDHVAKGVGMRGTGNGIIDFTGQIPSGSTILSGLLYWAIIQENNREVITTGTLNGTNINGNIVGVAGDPCWIDNGLIHVLYADVTNIVNTGVNTLTNFPTGPDFETLPLLEGASLIIIYQNPNSIQNTILVYDGAVSFSSEVVITMEGFTAPMEPLRAKTTYIVADGQPQDIDTALFNGTVVQPDNAFPGADGPLWDTLTKDVSNLVNPGDTMVTADITTGPGLGDCLTWLVQVFSVGSQSSHTKRGIKLF